MINPQPQQLLVMFAADAFCRAEKKNCTCSRSVRFLEGMTVDFQLDEPMVLASDAAVRIILVLKALE